MLQLPDTLKVSVFAWAKEAAVKARLNAVRENIRIVFMFIYLKFKKCFVDL